MGSLAIRSVLPSINALIKEIQRAPFEGIGKLEPLNMAYLVTGPAASMRNIVPFIKSSQILFFLPSCVITTDIPPQIGECAPCLERLSGIEFCWNYTFGNKSNTIEEIKT